MPHEHKPPSREAIEFAEKVARLPRDEQRKMTALMHLALADDPRRHWLREQFYAGQVTREEVLDIAASWAGGLQ